MPEAISPFDFAKTIHEKTGNLMAEDPSAEKSYNAFMVNRCLSYYADTILQANAMNIRHGLSPKMQYDFLMGAVTKRRRYSKWAKPDPDTVSLLDAVSDMLQCSRKKAIEAVQTMGLEVAKAAVEAFVAGHGGQAEKKKRRSSQEGT